MRFDFPSLSFLDVAKTAGQMAFLLFHVGIA